MDQQLACSTKFPNDTDTSMIVLSAVSCDDCNKYKGKLKNDRFILLFWIKVGSCVKVKNVGKNVSSKYKQAVIKIDMTGLQQALTKSESC